MSDKNLSKDSNTPNFSAVKKRLLEFIEYKKGFGKFNVKRFEDSIGVSNAYVAKMRASIGDDVIGKIEEVYPELNTVWLKMGKGEMLKNHPDPESIYTSEVSPETLARPKPLYDTEVFGGKRELVNTTDYEAIIGWVRMPGFEDCIGWTKIKGDSMSPIVKAGDFVAVMPEVDKEYILPGALYIVSFTGDKAPHPMLKYVHLDGSNAVLKSVNKKYGDMIIKLERIKAVYPARAGVVEF
jgi:hypothetical protein